MCCNFAEVQHLSRLLGEGQGLTHFNGRLNKQDNYTKITNVQKLSHNVLERFYLRSVLSVTSREFRCLDPALSLFCEAIRAKIGFADMGLSTLLVDWCHYVHIVFKVVDFIFRGVTS